MHKSFLVGGVCLFCSARLTGVALHSGSQVPSCFEFADIIIWLGLNVTSIFDH